MAESGNVADLVMEQLKLLCSDMAEMRSDMAVIKEKLDDLAAGQQALLGVVMSLGRSVYLLEHRVEAIEGKLGVSE